MKNTKELMPILSAIFAINMTSKNEDKDITLILDYTFRRIFGTNTNLLTLACIGKTKNQIMHEVRQILDETKFEEYIKEYEKNPPW